MASNRKSNELCFVKFVQYTHQENQEVDSVVERIELATTLVINIIQSHALLTPIKGLYLSEQGYTVTFAY
jgi:hypothetical protein